MERQQLNQQTKKYRKYLRRVVRKEQRGPRQQLNQQTKKYRKYLRRVVRKEQRGPRKERTIYTVMKTGQPSAGMRQRMGMLGPRNISKRNFLNWGNAKFVLSSRNICLLYIARGRVTSLVFQLSKREDL